jgi:hypothetical protein
MDSIYEAEENVSNDSKTETEVEIPPTAGFIPSMHVTTLLSKSNSTV